MNDKKSAHPTTVAVLFGGASPEYDISLLSAATVIRALALPDYRILPIGLTRTNDIFLFRGTPDELPSEFDGSPAKRTRLYPVRGGFRSESGRVLSPDCIFPVMHGGFGENGGLQGLLSYVGLPYVGCGVLASALASDKRRTKDLLRSFGIPMLPYLVLKDTDYARASDALGLPFFLKPVSGGSSIGAGIVRCEADFQALYADAAAHGEVMAERYAEHARELEAAVFEEADGTLRVAVGEVIPSAAFYDYRDKYLLGSAHLSTEPSLSDALHSELQTLSARIFRALGCRGLSRIDFFLSEDMRLYFNEINTLPGMTDGSLYPSLAAKALSTDAAAVFRRLAESAALPL